MSQRELSRRNLFGASAFAASAAAAALADPGQAAAQAVGVKKADLPDLTIKEVKIYVANIAGVRRLNGSVVSSFGRINTGTRSTNRPRNCRADSLLRFCMAIAARSLTMLGTGVLLEPIQLSKEIPANWCSGLSG